MSYGVGVDAGIGYGDSDSWGGPENGVDLQVHASGIVQAKSYRFSEDGYLGIIIVTALILLWLMGAIVFKSARL